jgi:hypothetical protein
MLLCHSPNLSEDRQTPVVAQGLYPLLHGSVAVVRPRQISAIVSDRPAAQRLCFLGSGGGICRTLVPDRKKDQGGGVLQLAILGDTGLCRVRLYQLAGLGR